MNGKIKWRIKNLFNVGMEMEDEPIIYSMSDGRKDNKLVMTVAPQRLICPYGNT